MIIASAIKYHIDTTDSDVILCGRRHSDIINQLKLLGFKPHIGYKELEQGFIDNRGVFMNRYEAYLHAVSLQQIKKKKEELLYSEDLW